MNGGSGACSGSCSRLALVGSVAALLEGVALIFDEVGLEPFRAPVVWLLAIGAAVGVGIAVSPPEGADVTRVLRWVLELGALTLIGGVMWFGFAVLSRRARLRSWSPDTRSLSSRRSVS